MVVAVGFRWTSLWQLAVRLPDLPFSNPEPNGGGDSSACAAPAPASPNPTDATDATPPQRPGPALTAPLLLDRVVGIGETA